MKKCRASLIATALTACAMLGSSAAIAQQKDIAALQSAGLQRVIGLVGNWQLSRFQWDAQRNEWSSTPAEIDAGSISFRRMDHGKAFRIGINTPQYQLEGYFSFDVRTERYVLAVIDDRIGQLDFQQGMFSGDRLTLDNLKADTFYRRSSLPTHTRTTLQFSSGKLKAFLVEYSEDHGQSWKRNSLFHIQPLKTTK